MNLGIGMARGEYVAIVETDDIIEHDMMEYLYGKAKEHEADMAKGSAWGFFELMNDETYKYLIVPHKRFTYEDAPEEIVEAPKDKPELFWDDNFIWQGIYRTDFMRGIRFNETPGAAFQDIGAIFRITSTANKAVYLKKELYWYRRTNAEASSYNKKSVNFAAYEYEQMRQYVPEDPAWEKIYYRKMLGLLLNRFDFMVSEGTYWEESSEGIEKIRGFLKEACESRKFPFDELINDDAVRLLHLLFDSPRKMFEHDMNKRSRTMSHLRSLHEKGIGRKTVIFSVGRYGKYVLEYLQIHGYEGIAAYTDNDSSIWGSKVFGIEVLPPEDAVKRYKGEHFIIANKNNPHEIEDQLCGLGVERDDISVYNDTLDGFYFNI